MKITRRQLRRIILEERQETLYLSLDEKRQSEMRQFAETRGGARVRSEGKKIQGIIRGDSAAGNRADRRHEGDTLQDV